MLLDTRQAELERSELIEKIRSRLTEHLKVVGEPEPDSSNDSSPDRKAIVRIRHSIQRCELLARERPVIGPKLGKLLPYFAEGHEIHPERIRPQLVPVDAERETGLLFRLATMLWSVPVSRGFGRRIRFLVIDSQNGKLIGVFALGDPVFNLHARDSWIGWGVRDRERRLVNVMDAYAVGAVPPYSQLLGGKLVASLIGSREVAALFEQRYGGSTGIISGQAKHAKLALVTITSALGRSSIYNRVRLPGLIELHRIGETRGWGHFQIPQRIFDDMRRLLAMDDHSYASGHKFGKGPNWRLRVIREASRRVGLDPGLLRHGIAQEVFAMPLAENCRSLLKGKDEECILARPCVRCISEACLDRWIMPRSLRRPEYASWTRQDIERLFECLR